MPLQLGPRPFTFLDVDGSATECSVGFEIGQSAGFEDDPELMISWLELKFDEEPWRVKVYAYDTIQGAYRLMRLTAACITALCAKGGRVATAERPEITDPMDIFR